VKKLFLVVSIICLITVAVFAKGSSDPSALKSNANGSFVTRNDATYYYTAAGVMLTEEYIANGGDVWYFCNDGRGIKVNYRYLARNLIQIFDYGYDSCFLLIGNEKALWIDSMFGFGNLVKLTKIFTDKPIEGVAITHQHIDQIGGMFHFDKVYLNEADWLKNFREDSDLNEFATREARFADSVSTIAYTVYPPSVGGFYPGASGWTFVIDDYADNTPVNLIPFNDGAVIDVGGASIEAIHTPGHSPGMTSILFREHRILLTGDEVNHNTLMAGYGVTSYRAVVQGLIDRKAEKDEWDRIIVSHGIMESDAPVTVLEDMLDICNGIIDGALEGVSYGNPAWGGGMNSSLRRAYPVDFRQLRSDGGFVNLVYDTTKIKD
jgi:glyoxylase-like metal-dependent hydrolase (beta-lactamase superfamily II)